MQVVATLINGMKGSANHNNSDDVMYLPISMGFCICYQRYMALLGYNVWTTGTGHIIVEGIDNGKEVDSDDLVSFPMYYYR